MFPICLVMMLSTVISLYAHSNEVSIWEEDGYRYIQSNGIPDHTPGQFPNTGNPNTISEQHYQFRVTLTPRLSGQTHAYGHNLFGVALNGVPFDPGTAEFWNNNPQSGWNYEALSGKINLGVDSSHAHVQPSGAYHYHGIPTGLLRSRPGVMKLIGYAADGFPIYYQENIRSSYRVRSGQRPSGPGGRYDGTFVQDYEYVSGAGDLDECNGLNGQTPEYPQGIYHYYLTSTFPFVPRCLKGTADSSFQKAVPHGAERNNRRNGGGPSGQHQRHQPPQEAFDACQSQSEGSTCRFNAPHGTISGTCLSRPEGKLCIPR